MKFLTQFRELYLYRNKRFYIDPIDKKKPKVGNLLVFLDSDESGFKNFIKQKYWNPRYWQSYFCDKRFRLETTMSSKSFVNDINDIYTHIKNEYRFIKFTFIRPDMYQNRNLIYGADKFIEKINAFPPMTPILKRKNYYMFMDKIQKDARFESYLKKVYVVTITADQVLDNNYFIPTKTTSFTQCVLFRLMVEPHTMGNFIGSTFIFTNTTGAFFYFTITPEFVNGEFEKAKFKRFLRVLYGFAANDTDAMDEAQFSDDTPTKVSSKSEIIAKKIAKKMISPNASIIDVNTVMDAFGSDPLNLDEDESDKNRVTGTKAALHHLQEITRNNFSTELESIEDDEDDEFGDSEFNDDKPNKKKSEEREPDEDEQELMAEDDVEEEEPKDLDKLMSDLQKSEDQINKLSEKERKEAAKKAAQELKAQLKEQKRLEREKARKDAKMQKWAEDADDVTFGELDKSLKDLVKEFENDSIESTELPADVHDDSIKRATGQDFTRTYYKKHLDPTIIAIIKFFETKTETKFFVQSAEKNDISDPMNSLWMYIFKLKDENGKSHTIKFKMPKLVQNKFFYLNGTKKFLAYQLASSPVIKNSPNEVHIIGNLNQMYMYRFGQKLDPKIEVANKMLNNPEYITEKTGVAVTYGDSSKINNNYSSILEYDEYAKTYYSITISGKNKKTGKPKIIKFIFNQHDIRVIMNDAGIEMPKDKALLPVAITNDNEVIFVNTMTGKDSKSNKYTISDLILSGLVQYSNIQDVLGKINSLSIPKKYVYTRVYYKSRKLSLGVFLSYIYGFKELLKRMEVKYEFSPKRIRQSNNEYERNYIKFKDGYLYYDIVPIQNSLILNGIAVEMNTEEINLADMETDIPYLETFDALFKTRQMSKAFKDAKTFFIDPILTKVLHYFEIPTDFCGLMLYSNALLSDNSKMSMTKMQSKRIRKLELLPVFLYKELAVAYEAYKYKYMNSKGGRFEISENAILTGLVESRLLNGYDTLNPIRELENEGQMSYKGPGGCNVDDAYTLQRRAYDSSMVGVIAMNSPDSSSVGITKAMSLNPRIKNSLGFVKTGDDDDFNEIGFGNMGSAAELCVPGSINHDDSRRVALVAKESKHVFPAAVTHPPLIGNGVENVVPYMTSTDFIITAKEDGVVVDVDEKLCVAVVKYKSGKKEMIEFKSEPNKNSGMGFFIINRKEFLFKKGDKFKKSATLVRNPSYFSGGNSATRLNPQFKMGTLSWVGLIMSHNTYEDSSIITDNSCDNLATEVCLETNTVFGAGALLHFIVKVGQTVRTGDPLAIFEDEIDDPELNKLINKKTKLTPDLKSLEEIIPHIPRSKVTGKVQDIKIFYTVPESEMSESVRAFVNAYNNDIRKKLGFAKKHGAEFEQEIIRTHVGITNPTYDKIDGVTCPVGSILVKIYTTYRNTPKTGDKIVMFAAMKSVMQRRVPMHLAPYPLGHKERPIDVTLNPTSIEARMVFSMPNALYGNKCVWGLTEALKRLWNEYAENERLETSSTLNPYKIESANPEVTQEDVLNTALVELCSGVGLNLEDVQNISDDGKDNSAEDFGVVYLARGKFNNGTPYLGVCTDPDYANFLFISHMDKVPGETCGTMPFPNEFISKYGYELYPLRISGDKFNILDDAIILGKKPKGSCVPLPIDFHMLWKTAEKYAENKDVGVDELAMFAFGAWVDECVPSPTENGDWLDPFILFDDIGFLTKSPIFFNSGVPLSAAIRLVNTRINEESNVKLR